MNIVHVVTELGLGGGENVASNLAMAQAREHEATVIALRRKTHGQPPAAEALRARLARHGVQVMEIGGANFRRNLPVLPLKLARLFGQLKPDIVHSHTDLPDICVSLANRLKRVRIARTMHNTRIWDTWRWPGYVAESGFQDDLVISLNGVTRKTYEELRGRYNLRQSRYQATIANGVILPGKGSGLTKEDLVRRFGADPGKLQAGFFGRLTRQKGLDVLAEAAKKMRAPNIEFHIFGDGEDRETLEQRTRDLDLPLRFHGQIVDAPKAMSAFDVIVLPSRYEGFPLVPLEAQAAGTPVLATAAPGFAECLPPDTPLRVPVEDPDALAAKLEELAAGQYDLDELGRAARDWASRFSFDKTAAQYLSAYSDYLAQELSV